ncbi:LINE-1 retrotransposable element ORF1 protein [Labeo rohita]|uniref:LINE-1 retrotransposable element ORF1 protein n=1 Tax=Labeo rohita TaxID=84645 RepID=A0ABQ8L7S8_LABRO|nr:LINE-1 retrotransposable element ORF1 protein [Labeo rohita]
MASSLRKYKYTGKTAASKMDANTPSTTSESAEHTDFMDLKAELITSIKMEITALFQTELKNALSNEFDTLKSELQAVKSEIASNASALRSDLETIKTTVSDMERGLSSCSDNATVLQNTVHKLEKKVESLQEKCLDMEGRMRRSNIRILNVAEESGSCTPTSVSKLLKDTLKMNKEVLIDRSHRTLQAKRADGKPRAIIAKKHYYQDCVEILCGVRETGPLHYKGSTILIFPDSPPSVAHARSAFKEVRKLLRGREGVCYGTIFIRLNFESLTTEQKSSLRMQWKP